MPSEPCPACYRRNVSLPEAEAANVDEGTANGVRMPVRLPRLLLYASYALQIIAAHAGEGPKTSARITLEILA